jgi:HSP20 family protein
MYLVKHNSRRQPVHFSPSFNRLFDDFWGHSMLTNPAHWEEDSVAWSPKVDVKETENEYHVHADLPGLAKEDVSISLEDGVLTIKGERKHAEKEKDENKYYAERYHGNFSRTLNLPSKVDEKKIKADLKDGVLSISLPKAEEAKPREIAIS